MYCEFASKGASRRLAGRHLSEGADKVTEFLWCVQVSENPLKVSGLVSWPPWWHFAGPVNRLKEPEDSSERWEAPGFPGLRPAMPSQAAGGPVKDRLKTG